MTKIIILTFFLSTAVFAGGINKWVDENGVTHFGGHPPPSAKNLEKYYPGPTTIIQSNGGGGNAQQQLNAMRAMSAPSRQQRQYNKEYQRNLDNYKQRTGQSWRGRQEMDRLKNKKSAISKKMNRATGSRARSLRQQLRTTDDEMSRRQGYKPPARVIVDID